MKIPLNEFEIHVDEKILERGLSYFKSGAITFFEEISTGKYIATVSGTEKYTVQIQIKGGSIIQHYCECPYDKGPICKHVVATIFNLTQDKLEFNGSSTTKKKKRKKSVQQQVKEILKEIPHEELVHFIQNSCKSDKKFKNHFLASFGHLSQDQSKEFYQSQIQAIINTASDRHGWIEWSEMKHLERAISIIIENAEMYLSKIKYEPVLNIATSILDEMTVASQYTDDNNGEITYIIERAMDLLDGLAEEQLPDTIRKKVFEYCLSFFTEQKTRDWKWHFPILYTASALIETEKEADIVLNCLHYITGEYKREKAKSFKLHILKRFKDKKEVEKFIDQHISNPDIRTEEIKKAFEIKDFSKVIKLSREGIKCNEVDKPGLKRIWYKWLLRVAQVQEDIPKIIEYARYLFLYNFRSEQDYYQILKQNVKKEAWLQFLEDIIEDKKPAGRWTYDNFIRNIYIREEWWDRLFKMVNENVSLENIERNEQYLSKDYASELIDLYSERIINYMQRSTGRGTN